MSLCVPFWYINRNSFFGFSRSCTDAGSTPASRNFWNKLLLYLFCFRRIYGIKSPFAFLAQLGVYLLMCFSTWTFIQYTCEALISGRTCVRLSCPGVVASDRNQTLSRHLNVVLSRSVAGARVMPPVLETSWNDQTMLAFHLRHFLISLNRN